MFDIKKLLNTTQEQINEAINTVEVKNPSQYAVLEKAILEVPSDSTYKVPLTTILEINNHPNADRLSLATVYGFQVVIPKDKFKVNDQVIYIPVDSILTPELEALLFGPNAKIKLHHQRVRQIRIRGFPSQGMLVHPDEVETIINTKFLKSEQDLSAILGVSKYEPPEKGPAQTVGKANGRKKLAHPDFHSYNGLSNIKWFPLLFQEGEQVVIQEKLHGTNARAAKLPYRANTLWKKIKKLLKLNKEVEELYGSNRVDISNSSVYKGYYGEDIYGKVFEKLDVFNKLNLNETVFGEIIGPGIQKGYGYSLTEHKFVVFDVKILNKDGTQTWLSPKEASEFAKQRGFEFVPVLYEGPYNKALVEQLISGPSIYDPNEKVREGIAIKAADDYSIDGNKKALKAINPEYLDDVTNSDEH